MAVALLIEQVLKRILVVMIAVSLSKGGGVGNCHTVITCSCHILQEDKLEIVVKR